MSAVNLTSMTLGKVLDQLIGDFEAQFGRIEPLFAQFDVFAVADRGDDAGVGAGASDALLFQRLDDGRLGVAGRRLGKVLARLQLDQIERLLFGERRQGRLLLVGHLLGVLALGVDAHKAVELHDAARRAENVGYRASGAMSACVCSVLCADVGGRHVHDGRVHLAGDEALPDQPIEPQLLGREVLRDRFRLAIDGGGADRFVRVLRLAFGLELFGACAGT